jgi:hypothetical protein
MNRIMRWLLLALAIIGTGVFLGLSRREVPTEASVADLTPGLLTFRPARELAAALSKSFPGMLLSTPIKSPEAGGPANKPAAPSDALADESIITLKPGVGIDEIASRFGARVLGSLTNLNAHRLKFPDASTAATAREQLSADPQVAAVDWNYSISRPAVAESLGQSEMSSMSLKVTPGDSQGKIVVGLIDTAVTAKGTDLNGFLQPSISVAGDFTPEAGALTHGTAMAEAILQGLSAIQSGAQASNVRILPVDVYGANEATTTYQVSEGVLKAIEGGATIINLSLGSEGDSAILQEIIQKAHEQGIIFLGAAGNEPVTAATYPAAYPEVVAVTATDDEGNTAAYANRGSFIDIGAPGSVVVNFGGVAYLVTGTSAATALASGIAAGTVERQAITAANAEQIIREKLALRQ